MSSADLTSVLVCLALALAGFATTLLVAGEASLGLWALFLAVIECWAAHTVRRISDSKPRLRPCKGEQRASQSVLRAFRALQRPRALFTAGAR